MTTDNAEETALTIRTGGEQLTLPTFAEIIESARPVREFTGDVDVIEDKDKLINVPFYLVGWNWHEGAGVEQFASVFIVMEDRAVHLFNDGGVGLREQLRSIEEKHGNPFQGVAPISCAKGLRRSDYEGPTGPAHTYYFG